MTTCAKMQRGECVSDKYVPFLGQRYFICHDEGVCVTICPPSTVKNRSPDAEGMDNEDDNISIVEVE